VAITDHDRLADRRLLEGHSGPIILIPGIEISSADGHVLAFGIDESPGKGLSLRETVHRIRDQGGIAVLSHPFRIGNGVSREDIEGIPDVMFEGKNGRSWTKYNERATALGRRLERSMTGGSDAHEPSGIGRAWTLFPEDVQDLSDVLEALHRGDVQPRGNGLTFKHLTHSKLKGTKRWTDHYLGRREIPNGNGGDVGSGKGSEEGMSSGDATLNGDNRRNSTRNGRDADEG
jgi:predicted metal-dependent phosphoesterase TrpH